MQDGSITVPSEIFLWRKNTARWLIFKSSHIPLHLAQDAENQVLHVAASQFSPSVMSDSLQPHWLQHTRPLSITNSQRLPKLMSIESMIESNHLFLFLVFTFSMSPHFLSEERKKKEILLSFPFSSVHSLSCGWLFVVHTRLPCPSPTPRGCPNSCPSSWWCHPPISSSVVPFSSRLQSFPATGSFPVSQFFASGVQSIGVSASASILPINIQDWFPLGWTGYLLAVQGTLKSLLQHHSSKASILQHSAVFIVQLSHPYMTTAKTIALTRRIFVGKVMSLLLNMLSRLVITFLPRSKQLLISWLQ